MKKVFAVTGTHAGSLVLAENEEEAKKMFLKAYPLEKVLFVKKSNEPCL